MVLWLLLFLGLFTYFILQRSVAPVTRTPVWILWLVMMAPALIWCAWVLIYGKNQPMPLAVAVGPFLICPPIYWWLIHWGRREAMPPKPPVDADLAEESPQAADSTKDRPSVRPITQAEETQLRDCFPWSTYYLQNIEYRPQAVICWGRLRTNPQEAYQTVEEKITALFGDRFLLVFRETLNRKPFFALVPNPYREAAEGQKPELITRPAFALALLVIALFTTTRFGVQLVGMAEKLPANPALLLKGLPYALALMTILGVHELAHYLTARFYQIRTTLPYFIPLPFFLGTFGAFIQMRSPVPNRKALFDISIAGPLAGFIVTVPLLVWGLAHSQVVPSLPSAGMLTFDALNPNFFLLLSLLSKLALGSALGAGKAIALHPVAVAGYVGMIVTAFNLMPVGALDGGHIVHAMFGQRTSLIVGQIARFLMLILSFIRPELLLWALLLLVMPIRDEPALNDVSELDNRRDFLGLIALALLVLILLPAPRILFN